MAKNTVVLKVNGNLTIENGYKLTAKGGDCGGPKGMFVYCVGTLINNGEISMTAKGAYAKGDNVYLHKTPDNLFAFVPKNGGNGRRVGIWKCR